MPNHLYDQPDVGMVFAEDLNLKAMSRGMLCKHTLDAACRALPVLTKAPGFANGQFLTILEWVCWKRGVYFQRVNPDGTSQTCPKCHTPKGKKDLLERVHRCDICGYETDRDHAAAEVIRLRGLEQIGTQGRWGIENAYAVGLPGVEEIPPSRSETKPRKRVTRNAQSC